MVKTRIAVMISLAGLLLLGTTGCSIIGYNIGRDVDYGNGEPRIVAVRHVEDLESGSRVMILRKDSTLCEGELREISKDPSADYQKRYARRPAPPTESLFSPALGDTVILLLKTPELKNVIGVLQGFSDNAALLRPLSYFPSPRNSSSIAEVPFARIDTIYDKKGNRRPGALLQSDVDRGGFPTTPSLAILSNEATEWILWQDVVEVKQQTTEAPITWRVTGTIIGLAADAVMVTMILMSGFHGAGMGGMSWGWGG